MSTWGMGGRDVDLLTSCVDDYSPLKSKWVVMQHKKGSGMYDDLAFVPDHEFLDPSWHENHVGNDGLLKGKGDKPQWQLITSDSKKGAIADSGEQQEHVKDGELDCVDIHLPALENPPSNPPLFRDDEMESWLQYPLDDVLEANFVGSDWQDIPGPSPPQNQADGLVKQQTGQRQSPSPVKGSQSRAQAIQKPPNPPSNYGNDTGSRQANTSTGISDMQDAQDQQNTFNRVDNKHECKLQSSRVSNAAAALALGAQRAAGLIPTPMGEPFSKLRTSSGNLLGGSQQPGPRRTASMKVVGTAGIAASAPPVMGPKNGNSGSATVLTPSSLQGNVQSNVQEKARQQQQMSQQHHQPSTERNTHPLHEIGESDQARGTPIQEAHGGTQNTGTLNFSHFSRPAHMYSRANMKGLAGSGVGTKKMKPVNVVNRGSVSNGSSVADSNLLYGQTTAGMSGQEEKRTDVPNERSVEGFFFMEDDRNMPGCDLLGGMGRPPAYNLKSEVKDRTGDLSQGLGRASTVTSNVAEEMNKVLNGMRMEREVTVSSGMGASMQSGDFTFTGNAVEMTKDTFSPLWNGGSVKRSRDDDVTVGQSEDLPEESQDTKRTSLKKAPSGVEGSAAKRARAAEVHNQSERRRRDRINDRMKTLQELIPNSNKTDKASMLDEAIEYLKMLQLQLQVMSMRTGIGLPPGLTPEGVPSCNMAMLEGVTPQMTAALNGAGMGLGMGGLSGSGHMNLANLAAMGGLNGLGGMNALGMSAGMSNMASMANMVNMGSMMSDMSLPAQQRMMMEMMRGGMDVGAGGMMMDNGGSRNGGNMSCHPHASLLSQLQGLSGDGMSSGMNSAVTGMRTTSGRLNMASSMGRGGGVGNLQSQAMSSASVDGHRQLNPSSVDPLDAYMARHQQMQSQQQQQQQAINLDLYQTYLMQQQQHLNFDT